MKKVLLINDFERGGGAEGVFQMTADLMSHYYEVFQYTAYVSFEDSGSNPFSYIYSRKHFRNIKDLIVKNNIDIVHIHNFRWISPSVLHVNKWLKRHHDKKVKFIVTAHDYLLSCPNVAYGYYEKKGDFVRYPRDLKPGSFLFKQMDPHGFKFSVLKKLQWYWAFKILHLQKQIDIVITPSIFLQEILRLNYPYLPIQVIRNPLPQKVAEEKDFLQKRGMERQLTNIRLIYFGRVASEKGTDLLLKMLSEIKNKINFSLDIYGTGPLSIEIMPLIKRLGLEGFVVYHGYKAFDDIQKEMINYDAFVMSSIWYENAPLSIIEAAVNGLFIITPNMGGMKELAELSGNYSLYELEKSDCLLQSLNQVAETSTNSDNYIDEIKKIFSSENYIKSLCDCYK